MLKHVACITDIKKEYAKNIEEQFYSIFDIHDYDLLFNTNPCGLYLFKNFVVLGPGSRIPVLGVFKN